MAGNETKHLEAVVALLEELNFTRAAKRVGVSQSALTKAIHEIEHTAGVQLFERNRQRVDATEACRAYVEQARLSLLYADRALQVARRAARDAVTLQYVGTSPNADPFLVSLLRSTELSLFPSLKIEIQSEYSYDLIRDLLAGRLDLAIANEPPDLSVLSSIMIAESPLFIAMSRSDTLAQYPSLHLTDLQGRRLIIADRVLHPMLYDDLMDSFSDYDVRFDSVQHILVPEEAFPLLSDASCVALLAKAGAIRVARSGVTIRPLYDGEMSMKTFLVSRADNESRLTSELVRGYVSRLESFKRRDILSENSGGDGKHPFGSMNKVQAMILP